MSKEFTEEALQELEVLVYKGGPLEWWTPHIILELIDEIKRFRGLPVEKWPSEFLPDETIAPVEFDFSEVLKRRD